MRARLRRLVFVALLGAAPVGLEAQTTDPINATIQFNFSNPGARSLALGGAFTARADDATAAYANPAGLLQLYDSELSVEVRSWSFSSRFLDGGAQTTAGGFDGLEYAETSDRANGLSFVSAMYPSRSGRWVAGLFRHQLANFRAQLASDVAFVLSEDGAPTDVRPIFGVYDLEITTFGVSGALRVSETLALGATLAAATLDLGSRTERADNRDQPLVDFIELDQDVCCVLGPRDDIITVQTQSSAGTDNDDLSLTAGFLWRSPARREGVPLMAVGGMVRLGPELDFVGSSHFRTTGSNPPTRGYPAVTPENRCPGGRCPGRLKVPDVYALALSFRPSRRWVVSVDYNRVRYSQLVESTLELIRPEAATELGARGPAPDFLLEDGDELRLGAELGLFRRRRLPDIYVRAGAWSDPDHETRFVGDDAELRGIWAPGSDELHYSAGAGLRYRKLQVDAAIDLSPRVTTASLSAVYYFRNR